MQIWRVQCLFIYFVNCCLKSSMLREVSTNVKCDKNINAFISIFYYGGYSWQNCNVIQYKLICCFPLVFHKHMHTESSVNRQFGENCSKLRCFLWDQDSEMFSSWPVLPSLAAQLKQCHGLQKRLRCVVRHSWK